MNTRRTSPTEADFLCALTKVKQHLRMNHSIRNTSLRELTGLNYDQAIRFFNRAIGEGVLVRRGKAAGTHYVLSSGDREDR